MQSFLRQDKCLKRQNERQISRRKRQFQTCKICCQSGHNMRSCRLRVGSQSSVASQPPPTASTEPTASSAPTAPTSPMASSATIAPDEPTGPAAQTGLPVEVPKTWPHYRKVPGSDQLLPNFKYRDGKVYLPNSTCKNQAEHESKLMTVLVIFILGIVDI